MLRSASTIRRSCVSSAKMNSWSTARRSVVPRRRSFASSSRQEQEASFNSNHRHRSLNSAARDAGLRWTSVVNDDDGDSQKQVPGPKGIPSRAEQIRRLQQNANESIDANDASSDNDKDHSSQASDSAAAAPFDVLVIGGGATGAGIALDAATRNLRVACIERGDFASETSSRSTKLIWAGLKYLGTATSALLSVNLITNPRQTIIDFTEELRMVKHCHQERRYMVEQQKHLTNWIPIVVPFDAWYVSPPPMDNKLFGFIPFLAPLVFKFYDALSSFSCPPSYMLSKSRAKQVFPQLGIDEKHIKYCAVFYEAQHNDARTNLAIAMTAAQRGAAIANYVEAIDFIRNENGIVIGAKVMDRTTGKTWNVYANKIVLAGGPFTDGLRKMEVDDEQQHQVKEAVQGASGTHIVLPGYFMPKDLGLLDMNTSDGRFLFMLPWQGHTLVGTTDKKNRAETLPSAPEDEIEWLLNECQKYLSPDLKMKRSDVLSSWRGWRPLAVDPNAAPGAPVSRDHIISENPTSGVMFVAGGKWTTWRLMAEEVTDRVVGQHGPKCLTLNIKLHGGDGFSDHLTVDLIQKYGLDEDVAEHLVRTYGARAVEVCELGNATGHSDKHSASERLIQGFPYVSAEVTFACREYACTIEDVLSRRTRLAFLNQKAALEAVPRVADIMAHELGWTDQVKQKQVAAAEGYIASYGGHLSAALTNSVNITDAVVDSPESLFTALDLNGDGFIDRQGVSQVVHRLGLDLSDNEVEKVIAEMDASGQGRVTVAAFKKWWDEHSSSRFRRALSNLQSQTTRH
ncbi:hypothetical protein MPSEU_000185200 [Mayamaea pseudoterrestris]|nr:hypothetical protein MPSEU_000185200 [Mayamaea pseudoterrestris]